MRFIGIDIGTSKICGVAFDYESMQLDSIIRESDLKINTNNIWEKIQNPQKILSIVEEIIDEFLQKFSDIKGIGITGQMHGIVYVDKNGNSISQLINWQDGRGNLFFKDDLSYVSYLIKETGYPVASGFGLVTHFYNLHNRLIPDNTHKICTIMDYIIMKLSGNKIPLMDISNAASLGFFNLETKQFDLNAIKRVSIDPEILPEIVSCEKTIGYYNKDIPIYPAIGDNQASFLGSISEIKKSVLLNIGTSGQISVYSDNFVKVNALDTRPFPGGGYLLVGASLCGGNSFNLLKVFFEKTFEVFSGSSLKGYDFYKIANSIDPSLFEKEKLLEVKTLFDGTRINPDKRGSINNISMDNFTPLNLILVFFNGVCNELYDFFNIMPEKIRDKKFILVGSGNAIRMNKLLRKVLENRFEYRLIIPKHKEEAAFGACLCAIVGGKYVDNFMKAGKFIEYHQQPLESY